MNAVERLFSQNTLSDIVTSIHLEKLKSTITIKFRIIVNALYHNKYILILAVESLKTHILPIFTNHDVYKLKVYYFSEFS